MVLASQRQYISPVSQVWEAIQELKAEAAWKVESIMQFATAFEAQLATGQPHDLPVLQAPKQPPIDPSLSAPEVRSPQDLPSALRCQYQLL